MFLIIPTTFVGKISRYEDYLSTHHQRLVYVFVYYVLYVCHILIQIWI
jgi:IS4 transposase